MTKKNGFTPIIALFVILLVIGGIWVGISKVKQNQTANPVYTPNPSTEPSTDISGWKTYTNSKYGYSFKYPHDMEVLECQSGDVFPVKIERGYDPCQSDAGGHMFSVIDSDLTKELPSYYYRDYVITRVTTVLDGKAGVKYVVGKSIGLHPSYLTEYILIFPLYGKYLYIAGGSSENFNQILSTFKFGPEKQVALPTPPPGWKAHVFNSQKLTIYTPTDWDSNIQSFPESLSTLIKFWKRVSPNIVPIQLDIKADWNNTGDAQFLTRNYTVGGIIPALRVDPPSKQNSSLERYEMVTYFEYLGKVHVFECVHNWTPDYVDTCNKMLETMRFTQ